jgi:DNA polymerase I-like protein with 3'-5' exonuclease and polymerase domains
VRLKHLHADLPDFIRHPNPSIFLGDNYVVLDFETTNHEKGSALDERNSLILARWRLGREHPQFRDGGTNAYAKWGDEFSQGELEQDCAHADFIVAHGAKFELGWLKRCGLDLRKLLPFDTMIGEKVLAGNRKLPLDKQSLDATAARRGLGSKDQYVSKMIRSGVCPSQIPAGALETYCAQDVALTEQIFLEQRAELAALGLLPVAFVRNVTTPALADIEFAGMALNPARVSETYSEYATKYAALEDEFKTLTGGINVKSPKQMAAFIYGHPDPTVPDYDVTKPQALGFDEPTDYRGKIIKTPAGGAKTDKETLAGLKAKTPAQKAFLKVAKELVKLKTPLQNLTKMNEICKENPNEPIVYASYNQTVTATDRLSSTGRRGGFQFHNFDRAFKKLFRARRLGWLVCEADAPQLEFRVAAFLGHDQVAIRDIQEGVDVHANTSTQIFGTVTPELRQQSKPKTFRPLYGGNSGTPREQRYYEWFRNRYDGIYRTQSGWTVAVARDKFLITPWGLRFYWPDAEVTKYGYIKRTTEIFNYPIQSFATADIIPLCLVLVWHRVADLGESNCLLVNTIHDSVIAEIDPKVLDKYTRLLVDCFTSDIYELIEGIYGIKIDVPLGVGIKAGEHWGEGKEQKFEPA